MKTLNEVGCGVTCTQISRTGWGPGPWVEEPDREDFRYAGLACFVHRGPSGHWCGYVGVPPAHPLYGKNGDDIDVEVHGGLTYSSRCAGHICHVPRNGEPDTVWWFGFDCAHLGDMSPADNRYDRHSPHETYKTVSYAKTETRRLAKQLKAKS